MSAIKDQAIQIINALPEDCNYDDIQYHLYLWNKIQRGEREIEEGKTVPHEEAKRRLSEWLTSSGLNKP